MENAFCYEIAYFELLIRERRRGTDIFQTFSLLLEYCQCFFMFPDSLKDEEGVFEWFPPPVIVTIVRS